MSRDYILQPFRSPVELQIDYARQLNPQQHAAVTALPGPALVIAGAGSGKTRTLTYRVAYLIEQGIPPGQILLLTFTNKAAKEMMRRVADLLGSELSTLWGGTFHSIGARTLRRHANLLGYQQDFNIMDREDAKDLLNACIADAEIDVKATRFPKAEVLGDVFSMALNTGKTIEEILAERYDYFAELAPQVEGIRLHYVARKRSTNAMDFDDLLSLWLKLLQDNQEVREHYQRRFQFILVDEYQDTNQLQGDLIDLLAVRHKNVMVVGDDSQSIYSWRGANFRNILEFPKRYPGANVYKIEVNYRSTPEILSVANAAIAANINQFAKELSPARQSGGKPVVVTCGDGGEQAAFVAQRVLELREEGQNINEMAVLYRSHFHALELQLELTRRNIPFSITSGIRFFEQAHVKDVAAFLKLASNARDELSFKRLARLLPGIGGKGAEKLWSRFQTSGANHELTPAGTASAGKEFSPSFPSDGGEGRGEEANLLENPISPLVPRGEKERSSAQGSEAGQEPVAKNLVAVALQKCAASVPKKAAVAWAQFIATMAQLETEPARGNPSRMIRLVIEAGYKEHLQEEYANYRQRLEDLEQLANFAQQFKTLEEFLTQLALLSNVEAEDNQQTKDSEQLRLSSIHQAKGLEFDVVFVIMLCDGLFPSGRSLEDLDDIEEERRLFYVAVTRARNELYLSYPIIRMMPGGSGDMMQQPSRFLGEIPKELVDEWNLRPLNPYG